MSIKEAIEQGNIEQVNELIKKGYSVNETSNAEPSPLHIAVKTGNLKMVDLLIKAGANVDNGAAEDGIDFGCGKTPLMWAAKYNQQKIALRLLMAGAFVNEGDYDKHETALHYAAQYASPEMVHLLLLWHADANSPDCNGKTPLHCVAERKSCKDSYEIAYRLIALFDARVNQQEIYSYKTALHMAAEHGNTEVVKVLLENGADVNIIDRFDSTPLHYAAKTGNLEIVKMLSEKCTRQNIRDIHGKKPIDYAILNKHTDVAKLLQSLYNSGNTHY